MQFGWDPAAAQERERRERLEREVARHLTLSRLGCLGLVAAVPVALIGGVVLWYALSSSDGLLLALGGIVTGAGVVLAIGSSAFNMVHFGLYYAKRAQRGRPFG
jgi:hypothetical protein